MPGRDGSGPAGFGPMSGRGIGCCSGGRVFNKRISGRGSLMGAGNYGRDICRRLSGYGFQGNAGFEIGDLKKQAEFLRESLRQVDSRIREFEGSE